MFYGKYLTTSKLIPCSTIFLDSLEPLVFNNINKFLSNKPLRKGCFTILVIFD